MNRRQANSGGPSRHIGTPKDLWALHGWRHPFLFLHAVFYYGNTRRYINILATTYELIQKFVPRPIYRSKIFLFFLRWMPERYHGKVLTLEDSKKIFALDKDIEVDRKLAHRVLPFEHANQIVIKNPNSIAIGDCGCRLRKKDSCKPVHVCMFIGEPFASYAVAHGKKTLNVHYATREEALEVLQKAHDAGFVHNAYFKDAAGDRLFALCNCCKCCCGVMSITRDFKDFFSHENPEPKMLVPSGFVAVHDPALCIGCGACFAACPFDAVQCLEGKQPSVIWEKCFGCGICVEKCERCSITLQRDEAKGIPLNLEALLQEDAQ